MSDDFIPLSVPNLRGNELEYVTNAVKSEWVSTAGSYVADFEEAVANYLGVDKAVACQSGTAGLHVSLQLLGVGSGDMVIAPALTFIAAVNPIRYLEAEPAFMDCDDSLCMDPVKVRKFCETECVFADNVLVHKASGRSIKAIVIVHVFGNMADMPSLLKIAEDYNLRVLEDATEALGTYCTNGPLKGKYAGTMGDMGVFSFNGNKIITTGGGGMIVSKNDGLARHAKHLTTQAKSDTVYFEHDEVGYNYRLTNLQAALGLAQMEQLESFIKTKKSNYDLYQELFSHVEGLEILPFRKGTRPNYWFYSLICDGEKYDRDKIIVGLSAKGIQTRPIWGLINEQVPYRDSCEYEVSRAGWYRKHIVNIPCSTNLTEEEVRAVIDAIVAEEQQ